MPDINMQVFEETRRNQLVTEVDIQTQVALDDYQVQLSDIANPTQSQDNVVIDRFGEFLPHWNESLDFDTWVKMNMELAGKKLLIVHGNEGLSSRSSGNNTFIQYHGVATSGFLDSLDYTPPTSFIYEVYANKVASADIRWGLMNTATRNDDAFTITVSFCAVWVTAQNENSVSYLTEASSWTTGWRHGKMSWDGTNLRGWWDDNEIGSGSVTTNIPNEAMGLAIHEYTNTGEQKWSFVRKYTATEPTVIIGVEQNIAVALKSLGRAG